MIGYNRFKLILEDTDHKVLWHATLLGNAESILQHNRFHLSEAFVNTDKKINMGYSHFMSTSFDLDNSFAHATYAGEHDLPVFMALDGNKLASKYKLANVDFFHYGDNREKEVRVLTNDSIIDKASTYIKYMIVVGYEEHKEEIEQKLSSRFRGPIYFFDYESVDENDVYNLDFSKAEEI